MQTDRGLLTGARKQGQSVSVGVRVWSPAQAHLPEQRGPAFHGGAHAGPRS